MIEQPWLSVIIPTYNGSSYLPFAMSSILAQNDKNIECLVVDDGSTDNTLRILSNFQRKLSIKIFQRQRLGNWVTNTNYALSFAKGEYISFLHQDDFWLKDRLSVIKVLIDKNPDIAFFLHPSNYVNGTGKTIGIWKCPLPLYPVIIEPSFLIEKLLIQNFISIPAPIFKRKIALEVGGLDDKLWYTADWDFWLKLAAKCNSLYYPKPLSGFRIHKNSQTIKRSISARDFREQLDRVVDKHLLIWDFPESKKRKVERVARFSIDVNVSLASVFHKKDKKLLDLLFRMLLLGPTKGYYYLRYSRVMERIFARIRAQLEGQY